LRFELKFFKKFKRQLRESLGIKKKRHYPALPPIPPLLLGKLTPEDIALKTEDHSPRISLIFLDDGDSHSLLNALAAIAGAPPRRSMEILVAAGRSGDPREALARGVAGARLIEIPGASSSAARLNVLAGSAKGDLLLFLRNGAVPAAGAIDALIDCLEATPDIGLVGARALDADGRQQSAGGIVWSDASLSNFGRHDDPMKPDYQYVRDVDFHPFAAILIARSLWRSLEGVDENLAEPDYQDADLAFRVRCAGRRVCFQPAANIFHLAPISRQPHGEAESADAPSPDHMRFASRWSAALASDACPRQAGLARARDRAQNRKTLLVIDQHAPEPDRDAGSNTMIEFMRSFQAMGWTVKFWPQNLNHRPVYMTPLQQMGVEVFYGPYVTSLPEWLARNGAAIDAVLLSRPNVAPEFLPAIRAGTKAAVLYYGHDLHFARMRLEAGVTGNKALLRSAEEMERIERDIWRKVDVALYPTRDEAEAVLKLEPSVSVRAVPAYCFAQPNQRRRATGGQSILFVGGFNHGPNVDAALWFARIIFPIIRRAHPEASLSLVGSNPKPDVLKLEGPGVNVVGWVSAVELTARYDAARVVVVPLRFGAGIKLKTVEALAAGTPVTTTAIGAQGLDGLEKICAVADSPEDFAAAVNALLAASDDAWLAASRRQVDYVASRFDRARQIDVLQAAVETAEANSRSRRESSSKLSSPMVK
jgi:O-antigen biosynthesis protein